MAFITPYRAKAIRRDVVYQTIMDDLIKLGVIAGNKNVKIEKAQDVIGLIETEVMKELGMQAPPKPHPELKTSVPPKKEETVTTPKTSVEGGKDE